MLVQTIESARLAVIGLGYVGLPVAVAFGKRHAVVGFDINPARIEALRGGVDTTLEVSAEELAEAQSLSFSADIDDLRVCTTFIVTVPTPIDSHKRPDLTPLFRARRRHPHWKEPSQCGL